LEEESKLVVVDIKIVNSWPYDSDGFQAVNGINLNRNAGGVDLYLATKKVSIDYAVKNNMAPLYGLAVTRQGYDMIDPVKRGYLAQDLNEGAGGDYIYVKPLRCAPGVVAKYDPPMIGLADISIITVRQVDGKRYGTPDVAPGYTLVDVDLNANTSKGDYIYFQIKSLVNPFPSQCIEISPGLFDCSTGALPASKPLKNGNIIPAGVSSQISNYMDPQYDAEEASYVFEGRNYWWREDYK